MNNIIRKILLLLLAVIGLSLNFIPTSAFAAGQNTIYVLPAISDNAIIDTAPVPSIYQGSSIVLQGAAGEYIPAKFAVYTDAGISGLTLTASNLAGSSGTIDKGAFDIKVVKCWWVAQSVNEYNAPLRSAPVVLQPDLLLKDDKEVKVDTQNYVELTDGSYQMVSQKVAAANSDPIPVVTFPVKDDAAILQPVNIPAGTNKQFWITIHIPGNAAAGNYTGTITLSGGVGVINVALTVLNMTLLQSPMINGLYYSGYLFSSWPNGSIGRRKSGTQLSAELADIKLHGITDIIVLQDWSDQARLASYLSAYQAAGFTSATMYWDPRDLSDNGSLPTGAQITSMLAFLASYGITTLYMYGLDEATGSTLTGERTAWNAIISAGAKIFVSGKTAAQASPGNYEGMGDIQDLQIQSSRDLTVGVAQAEAAKWHSVGHKIVAYSDPASGVEVPETYRRNYGLLLWQEDYDGAMEFSYQFNYGNIWNDFDDPGNEYKDLNFTYPTSNGVIDTIAWEGYREGITDIRYLTTLKAAIATAKAAGNDTSAAETWLANLKNSDLSTVNLDSVRSNMINFILSLQSGSNIGQLASIIVNPSNSSVGAGAAQAFSAQGYDSSNNPISGLSYTWNVTNPLAGSIDSNGTFTAGTTAGSYPGVIQAVAGGKTGTASVTVTQSYQIWDINKDGHVNVLEMILIGQNMGESGTPGWIPEDVNNDGIINVLDSIMIGQHFTG